MKALLLFGLGVALALAPVARADEPGDEPALTGKQPVDREKGGKPTVDKPAPAKREALCPVTGKPIDKQFVIEFRSKKVYFASKEAMLKFQDDSDKYLDAVQKQWDALKAFRTQVRCPVTGKPCKPEFSATEDGEEICFASEEAQKDWTRNKKQYASKLPECYTFQTNCLICGHEIDPEISVKLEGRTIYSACMGCIETIKGDTAKYLKQYDEQIRKNKEAWEAEQAAKKADSKKDAPTGATPSREPPK